LSRRRFCATGIATICLGACDNTAARISVGGIQSEDGQADAAHNVDLAQGGLTHDLAAKPGVDMSQASSTCSGAVSAGAASAIVQGAPKYVSTARAFVCRDGGGLYAMSADCTHAGCKLTPQSTKFYCSCHGATFDLNGQHPTSPAFSPLPHYALCVDGSGNVEIDPNQVVGPSTRA
jgi:nitrite reductase/ring-hydroxylating ferredoxin subunit